LKAILKYSFLLSAVFTLLLFSRCRKSDRNEEVINPAPRENAIANILFNDVFRVIHNVSIGDMLINGTASQGNSRDICVDALNYADLLGNFPNTMVVDFGDDQTACSLDGNIRNGKLRLNYSARYGDSTSVTNVEFIGYYVDSVKVDATMSITNKGTNSSLDPVFKVVISSATMQRDSMDINWNSTKTYTMIAGKETYSSSDDRFEVTGDSDGTTSKGSSFTADIIGNLSTDYSCNWFSTGKEEVAPNNMVTRSVDYGTTCSSSVNVQFYNTEYDFTLE
jgi:hypothetical protein